MTQSNAKTPPVNFSTPVGWIGTGVMGLPMCRHIMDKGYPVTVYSRTMEKTRPLVEAGATPGESPKAVASSCSIVFTMVGFPEDVEAVYLGPGGLVENAAPGSVLVDMTTTEPSLSAKIAEAAKKRGVTVLDAPVSGGDVGARNAALSIMVGGEAEALERVRPLLEAMGKNIVHQGPAGMGQHAKMCNQIVIAGTMIGVCESLLYGYKAGLNLPVMLQSVQGGAARCWTLENLAPRILDGNFDPGFFVDHFIKDMGIALKESARMRLCLPGLALVRELYLAVSAQGCGKCGTHALMLALERLSGIERELK